MATVSRLCVPATPRALAAIAAASDHAEYPLHPVVQYERARRRRHGQRPNVTPYAPRRIVDVRRGDGSALSPAEAERVAAIAGGDAHAHYRGAAHSKCMYVGSGDRRRLVTWQEGE